MTPSRRIMRSIIDYIEKYGELSITELPFNEVDSLILCQLSYLKFDGMLPSPSENRAGRTLEELSALSGADAMFAGKVSVRKNRALLDAAKSSRRFGKMLLNNYISLTDGQWEIQFCALTFTFENGLLYLAFRGTDETITGWKEDFNMALLSPVPAQEKAVQYLNTVASLSTGGFLVGGHSKGGNLAVYGAAKCYPDLQKRILTIYNHDGPGFPKGTLMETDGFLAIRNRIQKYIPHSSIVGMLFESHEPYEIVECRHFGVLQHDPYNWIVEDASFRKVSSIYAHTALKDESINRWIDGLTKEETQVFVDSLFSVLTSTGADTLFHMMEDWARDPKAMMRTVEGVDPKTREMLTKILTHLFACVLDVMKLKAMEKTRSSRHRLKAQVKKWQEGDGFSKK